LDRGQEVCIKAVRDNGSLNLRAGTPRKALFSAENHLLMESPPLGESPLLGESLLLAGEI
jgi:hypothetical protein